MNLMSVDAQRLMDSMPYINLLWSGPFQIGVSLYFLHRTMGWPIYAGLGVMVLFMPLNVLITRKVNKFQVFTAPIGYLYLRHSYRIYVFIVQPVTFFMSR